MINPAERAASDSNCLVLFIVYPPAPITFGCIVCFYPGGDAR